MGRRKTISDDDVLRVARELFREQGSTATTREIAQAAGISEGVLYQRFGSKDRLFFEAMRPLGPDLDKLLGPKDPPGDARAYLRAVVVRMARHFADVIPLALRVMTHPMFDPDDFFAAQPHGHLMLQEGLAARLGSLVERRRMAAVSATTTARLLVSLSHDWALAATLAPNAPRRDRDLKEIVDVIWEGLRVPGT